MIYRIMCTSVIDTMRETGNDPLICDESYLQVHSHCETISVLSQNQRLYLNCLFLHEMFLQYTLVYFSRYVLHVLYCINVFRPPYVVRCNYYVELFCFRQLFEKNMAEQEWKLSFFDLYTQLQSPGMIMGMHD